MNKTENFSHQENILIVDDNPTNLNLLSKILSEAGYKVRAAISSKVALRAVELALPDLILLDILMPEMDGYQVCEYLKSSPQYKSIPIVFISALNEVIDKVKAFSLGGVDYITKPFQAEEVLVRVENQLHIQRLSKQLLEQNIQLQQELLERQRAEQSLRESEELLKNSLKEKEVLLKEIHHRVKNNLQIVSSLLQMQARRTQDPQISLILQDSKNRISSIALVHEKLYRSDDLANIDFAQYIPDLTVHLFESYRVRMEQVTLHTQVDNIFLEIETAIPCGLIINELVSNSLKYAFPDNNQGEIYVEFHASKDETLTLIVRDNGIGIPQELDIETTTSLGLTLVQGLAEQLEGTLELDRSRGTEFKITFAAPKRAEVIPKPD